MKLKITSLAIAPIVALAAQPVDAAPGGRLGTLPLGHYVCALPGDATGEAITKIEGAWFEILTASSYVAEGGRGTYLLTGDDVVFTRGPMRGARFIRQSSQMLRKLDENGEPDRMRCTRQGQ
jgi:hypothetical protein